MDARRKSPDPAARKESLTSFIKSFMLISPHIFNCSRKPVSPPINTLFLVLFRGSHNIRAGCCLTTKTVGYFPVLCTFLLIINIDISSKTCGFCLWFVLLLLQMASQMLGTMWLMLLIHFGHSNPVYNLQPAFITANIGKFIISLIYFMFY